MNVTDYLLEILVQENISHLFLVPGGYIDPLMSALRRNSAITGIVAAHEGGAVFMADGYARVSGKFGVAAGIGGPGITNMMTGIATAFTDGIPLFIITGEAKTTTEGRGAFQDSSSGGINDTIMLQPITVKKLNLGNLALVQHHIKHLFQAMQNPANRGPVHLSLPVDIQTQEIDFHYKKFANVNPHPAMLDEIQFAKIGDLIKNQAKIVILAGTGVLHAEASATLVKIAEHFSIPVATTLGAKGVMPENHPLALGVMGWFGTKRANELLLAQDIDVLIVLGSRLNQMETMGWHNKLMPKQALIINDINASTMFDNYDPQLFVLGDNQAFLQAMLTDGNIGSLLDNTRKQREQWLNESVFKIPYYYDEENLTRATTPIHPARVINDLQTVAPQNSILFVGEGAHGFFTTHYWKSLAPGRFFITIKYMSPMGWSIPAAIGAKLAKPDAPVICITGDGSIMMHGMEIQTAARYNIPVIFIVFNNKAHGNPQLRGKRVGKFECQFLALPERDWAKFAESLGAVGMRVTQPEELKEAFTRALSLNKPVVIDILTGNYQTPTYLFDQYFYGVNQP